MKIYARNSNNILFQYAAVTSLKLAFQACIPRKRQLFLLQHNINQIIVA